MLEQQSQKKKLKLYYIDAGISGEIGFATEKLSEQDFDAKAEKLGNVISRIRIEG